MLQRGTPDQSTNSYTWHCKILLYYFDDKKRNARDSSAVLGAPLAQSTTKVSNHTPPPNRTPNCEASVQPTKRVPVLYTHKPRRPASHDIPRKHKGYTAASPAGSSAGSPDAAVEFVEFPVSKL
jgi:hypothetical protein